MAEREQTPAEIRYESVHLVRANLDAGILDLGNRKYPVAPRWQQTTAAGQSDEQVEQLAEQGNIGMVCGGEGGAEVVDIDPTPLPGETVDDAIARTKRELGLDQVVTPEVRTSKGLHMYFAHDPANGLSNCVRKGKLPFDIRTTGGQVVLPGSVHPDNGHVYRWVPGRGLGEVPLAAVPPEFVARLHASTPKTAAKTHADTPSEESREQYAALPAEQQAGVDRYLRAGIEAEAEQFMRTAAPGNRNEPLLKAACNIFELGNSSPTFDIEEIEGHLIEMGEASGHDPEAVRKTVDSARRRTAGKGRDVQAIAAKGTGTVPEATVPDCPPRPHDLENLVRSPNGRGKTALANAVRKRLSRISAAAVDAFFNHGKCEPKDRRQHVTHVAIATRKTPGGSADLALAICELHPETRVDPETWPTIWSAWHAPTPQDPTLREDEDQDDDREPLQVGRDHHELLRNAIRAATARNTRDPSSPPFFVNLTGQPARLAKSTIEVLGRNATFYELTTNFAGFRYEKNAETEAWETVPANIPSELSDLWLGMNPADAMRLFPIVETISNVPRLDPKTGAITTSGYDPATRSFVILAADLIYEMPKRPVTAEQLAAAVALIREPLHDFCFSSPADTANAFGMLLTGVLAGSWGDILTPLFGIDGPIQGSGKSLLAWIAAAMAGVVDEASASGRQKGTEAELDKMLGFEMSKGRQAIIVDNVTDQLDSPELTRVCTELRTSLRLNGGGTVTVRCNILKITTGNNLTYSADLAKRVVRIYLDPKRVDPENRSGWKIGGVDELKTHVRKNLGKLIAALHVIVLAWIQAGRPVREGVPVHGRFPDWSRIVGNVLAHAGINGFLANKDAVAAADDETTDARQVLTSVKAHADRMQKTPFRAADVAMFLDAEVRQIVLGGKHPDSLNLLLGRWLGKRVNTLVVIDNATWTLQSPGEDRVGTRLYQFKRQQ